MAPHGNSSGSSSSSNTLLHRVPSALQPPPPLVQPGIEELDTPATISAEHSIPHADFVGHRYNSRKRRMPQCISHRGFKARFPENTMPSFRGAVEAGTHALETDVHITKDKVVVLSHDPNLKRCYGVERKIKDCTWDEISEMRTVAGGEKMPRLRDLLEYLSEPGLEEIWVMLDIKLSNDPDEIMRLLGETIESVSPSSNAGPSGSKSRPWNKRILMGIWAAKFLSPTLKYVPSFPITNIGFSVSYARHFLPIENISFNMLLPMLIAPGGASFIRDCRSAQPSREVFAWTVNEEEKMEWCIRRQLDGLITDDPVKFLEVCDKFDERAKEKRFPFSLKGTWEVVRVYVWVSVMAFIYGKMFLPVASRKMIQKVEENGIGRGR